MPSHAHGSRAVPNGWENGAYGISIGGGTGFNGDVMIGNRGNAYPTEAIGGGSAHNNLQPYLSLNYIVKT